ncbi:MAG: PQQ-binding-like beta-propeller repeat protein [Planctomycetaceae bacterium]|nr:PQQ-binding-like beta-propeller repeat protein [Planctomycetaceae bacterium]
MRPTGTWVLLLAWLISVASVTYAGDERDPRRLRRSRVAASTPPVGSLQLLWEQRQAHPPQPAWPGPAKWDAYIHLRGLRDMRNYDHAPQVTLTESALYFTNIVDDTLTCLDAATGTERWHWTADGPIRMAPFLFDDAVYCGSDAGQVVCLSAETGAVRWRHTVPSTASRILNNGRFISPFPCRTGVLVSQTADGPTAWFGFSLLPWKPSYLCAVDARTGRASAASHYVRELQQETLEGPLALSGDALVACRGRVAPRLFQLADGKPGRVLSGGGGSFLTVAEDDTIWHGPGNKAGWVTHSDQSQQRPLQTLSGWNLAVPLENDLLVGGDTAVARFAADAVSPTWRVPISQAYTLCVVGQVVLIGCDGELVVLEAANGAVRQRIPVPGRALTLEAAHGRVVVATDAGELQCYRISPESIQSSQVAAAPMPQADDVKLVTERTDTAPVGNSGTTSPPPVTRGLVGRWVFHEWMAGKPWHRGPLLPDVEDLAGTHAAVISGPVQLREAGGAQGLEFDGREVSVNVPGQRDNLPLPRRELSVAAWVRVQAPLTWGGIAGFVQDNGSYERGWLLGYRGEKLSFAVAGSDGGNGLTYAIAPEPFDQERWTHAVGTYDGTAQRLYVNGELAAEMTTESGDILYPDHGFLELGAYRDDNEFFRMTGQLHEVNLYETALSPDEVRRLYEQKQKLFPQPITLPSGPALRFTGPEAAELIWTTEEPCPSVVHWKFPDLSDAAQTIRQAAPTTDHRVVLTGLPRRRVGSYVIELEQDQQRSLTQPFELDTYLNMEPETVAAPTDLDEAARQRGRDLLSLAGTDRGVAIVFGVTDGKLCESLLHQSRLRLIVFERDQQRIDTLRARWRTLGMYGARITVLPIKQWNQTRCVHGIANLVCSERNLAGESLGITTEELQSWLAPETGTALWRSPPDESVATDFASAMSATWNEVAWGTQTIHQWTRPASPNSGTWTHQYGRPDNSAFGGESLAGVASTEQLEVQWIGLPGPRGQPDRSGRKPSPLAAGGRLYVQGQQRLTAVDTANGSVLWDLEIPGFERFNIPRDCGNTCCDQRYVYIAVRGEAWQIDGQTGAILRRLPVVNGMPQDASWDWGYIAHADDLLIGSSVRSGTVFTDFWGDASQGWYDARSGAATHKIGSDAVFACDPDSGKIVWTHHDSGVVLNPTLTILEGRLYFVTCRHPEVKAAATRRLGGSEVWEQQQLVCLNLRTGAVAWETPVSTAPGNVMFSMAASADRLVLASSNNAGFDVYGLATEDGRALWHQRFGWPGGSSGDHGKAMSRPAIVGGKVYLRPRVLSLTNGELLPETMPGGGCGTYAATTNSLIFRQSNISLWDPSANQLTQWSRLRPGCWLSTIPACGMLLSPEAGGGCSCGSWIEASLGFTPTAAP